MLEAFFLVIRPSLPYVFESLDSTMVIAYTIILRLAILSVINITCDDFIIDR